MGGPETSHSYIGKPLTDGTLVQSRPCIKSVGGIENFRHSFVSVCKTLFDHCMHVMWNAVFYDSMAELIYSWRREKLWSTQHKTHMSSSSVYHLNGRTKSSEPLSSLPLDCPPGFESSGNTKYECRKLANASSPCVGEISSMSQRVLSDDHVHNHMESIIETVEEELHICAKTSLADYIESILKEEASKSLDIRFDENLAGNHTSNSFEQPQGVILKDVEKVLALLVIRTKKCRLCYLTLALPLSY